MREAYLGINRDKFEYETLDELIEEAKKYGVTIAHGVIIEGDVTIEDYVTIRYDVIIGYDVTIETNVTIGHGVAIEDYVTIGDNINILTYAKIKEGWTIDKVCHLMNEYRYHVSGYIVDGEIIIQMGCFTRTMEEWDNDFWNNNEEFKEGSDEGMKRFKAYEKMKMLMEYTLKENK